MAGPSSAGAVAGAESQRDCGKVKLGPDALLIAGKSTMEVPFYCLFSLPPSSYTEQLAGQSR